MDEYSVPVTDRAQWFKFRVFGGWAAAGLMFIFLLRCWSARTKSEQEHASEIVRARIDERTRARTEYLEDDTRRMNEIRQKEAEIKSYFEKLDSIKRKL